MSGHTYFISEVSEIVGVEPHVLRYWEEELGLTISRNSQGKRCYRETDVDLFRKVKFWKDKGMQLKAVRELLDHGESAFDLKSAERDGPDLLVWEEAQVEPEPLEEEARVQSEPFLDKGQRHDSRGQENQEQENQRQDQQRQENQGQESRGRHEMYSVAKVETVPDPWLKFEQLLDEIVDRALERNNERLLDRMERSNEKLLELLAERSGDVGKSVRWGNEEMHLRKLIREVLQEEEAHRGLREAAAATSPEKRRFWKRWIGRRK